VQAHLSLDAIAVNSSAVIAVNADGMPLGTYGSRKAAFSVVSTSYLDEVRS
jgi:hypothetical protein